MPRKKPLCAGCGVSLTETANILLEFEDLAGRPVIGWHDRCGQNDDQLDAIFQQYRDEHDGILPTSDRVLADILHRINRRGPGRLMAGQQFFSTYPEDK